MFSDYKIPHLIFFKSNQILHISGGIDEIGTIVWPLFYCLVIAWVTVFFCIMKGVKTVGKVVYFTATFPFVILFILLIRGLTLPGAWDGVFFYIYPQWHQLTNLKVIISLILSVFLCRLFRFRCGQTLLYKYFSRSVLDGEELLIWLVIMISETTM